MNITNLVSVCSNAWQVQDLSTCKPLGLDAETWLAALTALVGLLLFFRRCFVRSHLRARSVTYVGASFGRGRFRNLCRAIKPIMDENYRIFSQFGPNSGCSDGLPKVVRHELGVWYQMRSKIVENNYEIQALIAENRPAIPREVCPIFMKWLDHIDAFSAHVSDEGADYREHQFPKEVSEIITRHA